MNAALLMMCGAGVVYAMPSREEFNFCDNQQLESKNLIMQTNQFPQKVLTNPACQCAFWSKQPRSQRIRAYIYCNGEVTLLTKEVMKKPLSRDFEIVEKTYTCRNKMYPKSLMIGGDFVTAFSMRIDLKNSSSFSAIRVTFEIIDIDRGITFLHNAFKPNQTIQVNCRRPEGQCDLYALQSQPGVGGAKMSASDENKAVMWCRDDLILADNPKYHYLWLFSNPASTEVICDPMKGWITLPSCVKKTRKFEDQERMRDWIYLVTAAILLLVVSCAMVLWWCAPGTQSNYSYQDIESVALLERPRNRCSSETKQEVSDAKQRTWLHECSETDTEVPAASIHKQLRKDRKRFRIGRVKQKTRKVRSAVALNSESSS